MSEQPHFTPQFTSADFDADLKRAFAMEAEPDADGAFAGRVEHAVGRRERARRFGAGVRWSAMGVGGVAGAFGMGQAIAAIAPQVQAMLGPEIAMAMTAQAPTAALGGPMAIMLMLAAGAAGAWFAREATA